MAKRRRTDNTMAKRYQRVNRIRKSQKNRQHNGQKKKYKRTTNDLQKYTHKTKDRVTRTPLKTYGELVCPGRVGSSCSTSYILLTQLALSSPVQHVSLLQSIHHKNCSGSLGHSVIYICENMAHFAFPKIWTKIRPKLHHTPLSSSYFERKHKKDLIPDVHGGNNKIIERKKKWNERKL